MATTAWTALALSSWAMCAARRTFSARLASSNPRSLHRPMRSSSPSITQAGSPRSRKAAAKACARVVFPAPGRPVSHQVVAVSGFMEMCHLLRPTDYTWSRYRLGAVRRRVRRLKLTIWRPWFLTNVFHLVTLCFSSRAASGSEACLTAAVLHRPLAPPGAIPQTQPQGHRITATDTQAQTPQTPPPAAPQARPGSAAPTPARRARCPCAVACAQRAATPARPVPAPQR